MSSQPVVATDQRQREVRARALDENFDAQRRQIGERVAVMFRWIFLAVLTALVNLTSVTSTPEKVTVDIALGVWAAMNVVVTLMLLRGFSVTTTFMAAQTPRAMSTVTFSGVLVTDVRLTSAVSTARKIQRNITATRSPIWRRWASKFSSRARARTSLCRWSVATTGWLLIEVSELGGRIASAGYHFGFAGRPLHTVGIWRPRPGM